MEELKPLSEINTPDFRSTIWSVVDSKQRTARPITLEDHHNLISEISLTPEVSDAVISQFNIARNIALYSWKYYPLHQIAESKAFATLEFALKEKIVSQRSGLKSLLTKAYEKGLIHDDLFKAIPIDLPDSKSYCEHLIEYLPKLRNDLAHGTTMLMPSSIQTLDTCRELINMLYIQPPASDQEKLRPLLTTHNHE